MRQYAFHTVDVFTDRVFGGNPPAVFPDAVGLQTKQMQAVASGFNLSETAFVFPSDRSALTRHLRIFTPRTEMPFAGHPTIGTAYLSAAPECAPVSGAKVAHWQADDEGEYVDRLRAHLFSDENGNDQSTAAPA